MGLSVKLQRSYKSKNGNRTFVYAVSGKPADLDAYKEAQGDYYREDDKTGQALWFTTRCIGKQGELLITDNGNVIIDATFGLIKNPQELAVKIKMIPGVVESGLFIDLTDIVYLATPNRVEKIERHRKQII